MRRKKVCRLWWTHFTLLMIGIAGCTRPEIPKETGISTPLGRKSSPGQLSQADSKRSESTKELHPRSKSGAALIPSGNPQARALSLSTSQKRDEKSGSRRIVAIGDLHGDFAATRSAFRLAGAIDAKDKWSGANLIVVQTGDQLDRGDDEKLIFDLLARLQVEATQAGGELHVLNGNHEYMNALGDFRYVTPGALDAFSQFKELPRSHPAVSTLPTQLQGRRAAFLPGKGPMAKRLADRKVILLKGDSVFVHGGVLPKYVQYGVDRMNRESKQWLMGELANPPMWLTDQQGPIWTRVYSDHPNEHACGLLRESLDGLGAKRMVVGHTVQKSGIQSACQGKVWMIDVGMARAYGGTAQVLEIVDERVTVIK